MKILNQNKDVLLYTVIKEMFNNNVSISIQNGEVVVCAPWYLSKYQIQKLVEEKRQWILNKIKTYEETKKIIISNTKPRKAIILGKEYIINIGFKNIKRPELNLFSEKIKINFPIKYKKKNIDNILEIVLRKMYQSIAETKIEEIMEKTRIILGFAPEEYEIKKVNNKLSDCLIEDKKIIITPEIIKYNQNIIEYIIMHQFCHLKFKTHCESFNKIIKTNFVNKDIVENSIKNLNLEF